MTRAGPALQHAWSSSVTSLGSGVGMTFLQAQGRVANGAPSGAGAWDAGTPLAGGTLALSVAIRGLSSAMEALIRAGKRSWCGYPQVLCRLEEAYEARQARVRAEVRPRVGCPVRHAGRLAAQGQHVAYDMQCVTSRRKRRRPLCKPMLYFALSCYICPGSLHLGNL